MAYERHVWECGETITAEALNNIEGGVEQALEGGDKGYSCTEEITLLTEETVTTAVDEFSVWPMATLAYREPIEADALKVTFDGQEYICPARVDADFHSYEYGADNDWSNYPFNIVSGKLPPDGLQQTAIYTENVGTYNVKIEAYGETTETSDCFKKAVQSVAGAFIVNDTSGVGDGQLDKTYTEIEEAYLSGRQVIVKKNDLYDTVCGVSYDGASHFVETKHATYSTTTPDGYPSYRGK